MFMKNNGVKHIRSAPYHPASNGLAERFVQSLKTALKASKGDGRSLSHRLSSFLFTYRTTPHSTTGATPSSLFLKRDIHSRFDLLRPKTESAVLDRQSNQKASHDRRTKDRAWFIGQCHGQELETRRRLGSSGHHRETWSPVVSSGNEHS